MPRIEIFQKQAAAELESETGAGMESEAACVSNGYLNGSRAVIHRSHRIGKFIS